ncbi:DUF2634 domain-containing protein [Lactobacillus delbrueckii subsp. bulgaricus]
MDDELDNGSYDDNLEDTTDGVDDEDDQIDDPEDDEDVETSLTFEVANGRIGGKIDGQEAMIQAISKIMETERSVYPIYSEDYGNDLDELIGKSVDFVETEIERVLEEALKEDERVTGVSVDAIEETDSTSLLVTATVSTIYGDLEVTQEVDGPDGDNY